MKNNSEPNWSEVMNDNYRYDFKVHEVYDGDTIVCDIQLGFDLTLNAQRLRFYGINSPEVRGSEKTKGFAARDYLRTQLGDGSDFAVYAVMSPDSLRCQKGSFGRWLAIIVNKTTGENINKNLVENGFAKYHVY